MLTETENISCHLRINKTGDPIDLDRLNRELEHVSLSTFFAEKMSQDSYQQVELCFSLKTLDWEELELSFPSWDTVEVEYRDDSTDKILLGYKVRFFTKIRKKIDFGKCTVSFYLRGGVFQLRRKSLPK